MRTLPVAARRLVAVCGKCSRKLDGGFAGGRSLTKLLRRSVASAKGKRAAIRIVETRCLGLCPRRAVALFDSERPGSVSIVAAGTPLAEVAARLDLPLA